MTVAQTTGAASHEEADWHAINWQKVNQNVRRLQARIVKATKEGRWGKVKALQRLLTHSFSGKALAVRRVTENQGKRTPGVDGDTWNTPEKKTAAVATLRRHGYIPSPLRRIYIPKKNGKKRPLGIPTMKDRAMQALYLLALEPIAETTGDPNSYGFRPERSTADAIAQCFIVLRLPGCAEWVLEGDIKACFDRISHEWLQNHIPMDKTILQKWLKAGYMEQNVLYPTEEGTPQGGIASPVIANMALDGIEKLLREHYPENSRRARKAKINFVRYADDFIVTGSSQELLEQEIKPLIEAFMKERGLELSPEKTCITHIRDGFDFLGQNVRKYNGTLLIMPSKKNVQAFLEKVREIINAHKTISAGKLITLLNPVIRGWAQYHRHVVSKATFNSVDRAIFQGLWRWATRRHPGKSRTWVREKYFHTVGDRNWVFSGELDGTVHRLFSATSMPIQRHGKIKGAANPFDPEWECYFEERLGKKMQANPTKRHSIVDLWLEQHGICPVCKEKLTEKTGWHNHHIQWRSLGGSDKMENRVLLHPNCHRQVHSQRLTVTKPRLEKGEGEA